MILAHQAEKCPSNVERVRLSTVVSLTPSVLAALHGAKGHQAVQTDAKKKTNVAWKMFMINRPEWLVIVLGCLVGICNEGIQPGFGVVRSKLTAVEFHSCPQKVSRLNSLACLSQGFPRM